VNHDLHRLGPLQRLLLALVQERDGNLVDLSRYQLSFPIPHMDCKKPKPLLNLQSFILYRRPAQVLGVKLEATRHTSAGKLLLFFHGFNECSLQLGGLALPWATGVQEETATERIQVIMIREGGVVKLVALLHAGNVVIVNEATTLEILLAGSLSSAQLVEVLL